MKRRGGVARRSRMKLIAVWMVVATAGLACHEGSTQSIAAEGSSGSTSTTTSATIGHVGTNPGHATNHGTALTPTGNDKLAAFAAGCFWGVEDAFRHVHGVVATAPGYAGGHTENPTYEDVCSHTTGHAETVLVEYDPAQVSYDKLLQAFWMMHDPTQGNRKGPMSATVTEASSSPSTTPKPPPPALRKTPTKKHWAGRSRRQSSRCTPSTWPSPSINNTASAPAIIPARLAIASKLYEARARPRAGARPLAAGRKPVICE